MPASNWSLHSQLKKDTIDIGDLPLCKVLVIKDAHYPWLLLVPRRDGAVEIIDLDEVEQAQLMTEITRMARALKEVTKCDKLNVAALGDISGWYLSDSRTFLEKFRIPDGTVLAPNSYSGLLRISRHQWRVQPTAG